MEPKPSVPGGAGLSSASSRGAEAARAPLGLIQLRRLLHRQGAHRHNHELGYPFSRLDLIGLGSQVAQAHTDFSPVVAVDNPDPIGQRNPMLDPQSAACEYESGIAAARQAIAPCLCSNLIGKMFLGYKKTVRFLLGIL